MDPNLSLYRTVVREREVCVYECFSTSVCVCEWVIRYAFFIKSACVCVYAREEKNSEKERERERERERACIAMRGIKNGNLTVGTQIIVKC